MKKLQIKVPSLKRLRRQKAEETAPSRITNETVAEHRERILAGGRKFKYPVQYARHKLVLNAILITIIVVMLLVAVAWWQLYPVQNTSGLMYRITRIIPVPVAVVNGEYVPYRDYLLKYRASEYYHEKYDEIKLDTPDGKRLLNHDKRQSLDNAEQIAYARQLAREYDITVTDKDIDDFISQERNTASGRTSQETYDAAIKMYLDQTTEDYRLSIANSILKSKVAFAVDENAKAQIKAAKDLTTSTDADFVKIADQIAGMKGGKVLAGRSGMIDIATNKYNGLRISEVAKLSAGEVSDILKSTTDDGYYVVKVVNKTDSKIDFTYIHVPLSTFTEKFDAIKKDKKITEFIKLTND